MINNERDDAGDYARQHNIARELDLCELGLMTHRLLEPDKADGKEADK